MNAEDIKEGQLYRVRCQQHIVTMRCDGVSFTRADGTPALWAVNNLRSGCYEVRAKDFIEHVEGG